MRIFPPLEDICRQALLTMKVGTVLSLSREEA